MPIKKCFLGFILILAFIPASVAKAQDPWSQIEPLTGFGYGAILSVDWSLANGQLAVASESGFQFYDADMRLEGERRFAEPIYGTASFSPDLQMVAIQEDEGLIVRDSRTWEPYLALRDFSAPSWSPDSRYLSLWTSGGFRVWDIAAAEVILEVNEIISEPRPAKWSPDGSVVAVPGDGAVIMFSAITGNIVRIHAMETIRTFDWSADGRWFMMIGLENPLPDDRNPDLPITYDLMRVDALTGEVVMRYDLNSGGREGSLYSADNYVSISPNGKYVVATIARWEPSYYNEETERDEPSRWVYPGMGVWDLETGEQIGDFSDLERPLADVITAEWAPDGERFASARDRTLAVFEASTGALVDSLRAYIASTSETRFTSNGAQLVASGGLWDISQGFPDYRGIAPREPQPEPVDLEFLQPSPYVFDYSRPPYEWRIVNLFEDFVITYEIDIEYPGTPEYEDEEPPEERWIVWDIASGEQIEKRYWGLFQTAWLYDIEGVERPEVNTSRTLVDSTRFLIIGDDEIVDARTGEETQLEVNRWEWREVWFSPAGERVYAYDTDSRFKAFNVDTGELIYETVPAPRNAMRHTDDLTKFTLLDWNNVLYVYDAFTGELLIETYTGNSNLQMLWSEDTNYLAVGGDNNVVLIYHIPTRSRIAVLRGHQTAINSMGWNPACDYSNILTCNYVFTSSDTNGRVILWGVTGGQTLARQLPEFPEQPTLALPTAAIDYSELQPLWTYIAPSDRFGRATAHAVEWSAPGIRVNGDYFYDTELQLVENETAQQPFYDHDWTVPEEMANNGFALYRSGALYDDLGRYARQFGAVGVNDATVSSDATMVFTAENDTRGTNNRLSGQLYRWMQVADEDENVRWVRDQWAGGAPAYNHVALSPDDQWLASTTVPYFNSGGRGQIWNANTLQRQASLIGHTDEITQLYWHNDTIITSSLDGTVRAWTIWAEEIQRWRHDYGAPIVKMAWAGSALLLSAGDDLILLNPNNLEELRRFEDVGGRDFDWSPDQSQLVTIGSDSIVRVVDFESGEIVSEEGRHMQTITHMDWHPSGDYLAVGRRDGSVILLDGLTGTLRQVLRPYGQSIRSMSWNATGDRLLLDLADGPIEIVDGATGELQTVIENEWRRINAWWSPDGSKIAFGTYPDPDMGVYTATSLVWVHDANTGAPLHQLPLDWDDYSWYWTIKPFDLSWSQDGDYLAAFYGQGRLRAWNLERGGLEVGTHFEIGRQFSLAVWEDSLLNFWTTTGHGRLNLISDNLNYVQRDGLPEGTILRGDGQVLLAGNQVLDINTFYPLQGFGSSFNDAKWHPFCWDTNCRAILAVASGTSVTMYGFTGNEIAQVGE